MRISKLFVVFLLCVSGLHAAASSQKKQKGSLVTSVILENVEKKNMIQPAVPVLSISPFVSYVPPVSYINAVVLDIDPLDAVFTPKFICDANDVYNAEIIRRECNDKAIIAIFNLSVFEFYKQKKNLLLAYKLLPILRASFYVRNVHYRGYQMREQYLLREQAKALPKLYAFIDEGYFLNNKDTP